MGNVKEKLSGGCSVRTQVTLLFGANMKSAKIQCKSLINKISAHMLLRVSKSGRHADARLRKIVYKLRKILASERGTVKITSFNLILLILTHFFCFFMAFLAHFHAQLFLARHFDCAMKIAFRKSG